MKNYFPPQNQNYTYLQTNRSDDFGSIWSSFNLDFQTNLGTMRLAQKLVMNTSSVDDADMGLPVAFSYWSGKWWSICGTRIFTNTDSDITTAFTEDPGAVTVGDSTSQFDITNPAGTTYRYTWDGTGTNPGITALTFPIGATVDTLAANFSAGNNGTFLITGSGANYFEVTNASGVVESDKTIGGGFIWVTGGTFGKDYSTTQSDMVVFNDYIWTTTNTELRYRTTLTTPWRRLLTFTSSASLHKMLYFKKFDRLYVIDFTSSIKSVDNSIAVSTSGNYTLNPGTSVGNITTMVSNSNYIWLGSFRNTNGTSAPFNQTKGLISQWDGFSAQVENEFDIEASGVLAMYVLDDIPYAIDTEGRVLKYNGYSFVELNRLPIDRTLLKNSSSVNTQLPIHFNGFIGTKNNTLLISVNNLNGDKNEIVTENLPSGIWELDLTTNNFTHRYSPTLKTIASATVTDYGQNKISAVGAIKINPFQANGALGRGSLLAGFNVFTDATTVKSAIFIDSPSKPDTNVEGQKRGYYVTTWFNSQEIQDKWARIWATFRRFLNSTDKIIFKYRLNEEDATLATITWTSTTTFTTTTNVSAYAPTITPFNGTTGGEVEILQGTGAGSCTHISGISENAGTYTVTLDTAVTGVTGTAKARFQKWIKVFPEITGQVLSYGQMSISGESNTRIQIKCVMEFTGDDEFHKMALVSNEDIKINL